MPASLNKDDLISTSVLLANEPTSELFSCFNEIERSAIGIAGMWCQVQVCGPHPKRPGPMCPFLATSIKKGLLYIGVETDPAIQLEALKRKLSEQAKQYLAGDPRTSPNDVYVGLLLAFPYEESVNINGRMIFEKVERAVDDLKIEFMNHRRMIGSFRVYGESRSSNAAPANKYPPSPMIVIAMRYAVDGDDVFLRRDDVLETYYEQFPHVKRRSREELEEAHSKLADEKDR